MTKGDVYYLIDNKGYVVSKFEQTDDYMTGNVYNCTGWMGDDNTPCDWDYFAEVYCKWDGCTHWWFKGEDYSPDKAERDSYYHICGPYCLIDHVRLMCFIWKLAPMILKKDINGYKESIGFMRKEYCENDIVNQLIELTLKDYTIKKVEKEVN